MNFKKDGKQEKIEEEKEERKECYIICLFVVLGVEDRTSSM